MARIRSIKPNFFASEDVSVLPLRARLTWIGLWTQCDDHGRTKRNAKLIKAAIWPLDDVSLCDVEEDLHVLADFGRIVTYQVGPTGLLAVVNWHVHQSINRPGDAQFEGPPIAVGRQDPADRHYCAECARPGPNGAQDGPESNGTHGALTDSAVNGHGALTPGRERKGKEGRGRVRAREPAPSRKCPRHADDPDPPNCRACASARKAYLTWEVEQNARIRGAPQCPDHAGQLAANCSSCASERKART